MGIPMCKCAICGKETTKRQTFLIEPYGRICRNHPEVEIHQKWIAEQAEKAKQKLRENQEMEESLKGAAKALNVISLTEMIRVLSFQSGVPLEYAMLALGERIPADIREEVFKSVLERGPCTEEELSSSLITYLHLRQMAGK